VYKKLFTIKVVTFLRYSVVIQNPTAQLHLETRTIKNPLPNKQYTDVLYMHCIEIRDIHVDVT